MIPNKFTDAEIGTARETDLPDLLEHHGWVCHHIPPALPELPGAVEYLLAWAELVNG